MREARPHQSGSTIIVQLQRFALLLVVILLSAGRLDAQNEWDGHRVVDLVDEPRHRPAWRSAEFVLHDVRILPGDTSLYHLHDKPILTSSLSTPADGPTGGRVGGNMNYGTQPNIHRVINGGAHPLRIMALVNNTAGDPGFANSRPEGLRGDPLMENEYFRSHRIELAPGEETPVHRHRSTAFVIQATEGQVNVTRADGWWSELRELGAWAVRDGGSAYQIRNVGTTPVAVLINEALRPR